MNNIYNDFIIFCPKKTRFTKNRAKYYVKWFILRTTLLPINFSIEILDEARIHFPY